MIYQSVTCLLTGISAYFLIALILVAWPFRESTTKRGIATDELDRLIAGGSLIQPAEPTFFVARDGARRLYRLYPGRGSDLLIFLVGSVRLRIRRPDWRLINFVCLDVASGITNTSPNLLLNRSAMSRVISRCWNWSSPTGTYFAL